MPSFWALPATTAADPPAAASAAVTVVTVAVAADTSAEATHLLHTQQDQACIQ